MAVTAKAIGRLIDLAAYAFPFVVSDDYNRLIGLADCFETMVAYCCGCEVHATAFISKHRRGRGNRRWRRKLCKHRRERARRRKKSIWLLNRRRYYSSRRLHN
jgi:hypothetical protein